MLLDPEKGWPRGTMPFRVAEELEAAGSYRRKSFSILLESAAERAYRRVDRLVSSCRSLSAEDMVELSEQAEELLLLVLREDGEAFVDQVFMSRDDLGEHISPLVRQEETVGPALGAAFDQPALLHPV